jgi:hypothetical protein
MNSNIEKIIGKLVVQFATGLSKLDKRRLDAFGKILATNKSMVLPEELTVYVTKRAQVLTSSVTECELVMKYLLDNELIKITHLGKATVKLAISYEEFNQLAKYLSVKENNVAA